MPPSGYATEEPRPVGMSIRAFAALVARVGPPITRPRRRYFPWATIRISLRARSRTAVYYRVTYQTAHVLHRPRCSAFTTEHRCACELVHMHSQCVAFTGHFKSKLLVWLMYVVVCCYHMTSLDDHGPPYAFMLLFVAVT